MNEISQIQTDKELRLARLASQVKKGSVYSGLWANESFQQWKAETIDSRLAKHLQAAAGANMMTEEGRQIAWVEIIAHQELKAICDDVFKTWQRVESEARVKLDELKQPTQRRAARKDM